MRSKWWALTGICAVAVPLVVVATAFACGSLATLKLNRTSAAPGAEVKVSGGNFNSNARASTVQVRFNSRNGRVLWEGRPAANGAFNTSVRVPRASNGQYIILATQIGPDGRPAAGTPGRAPLRIRRSSTSSAVVAPWAGSQSGGPAAPEASPISVPVLAGIGLLAVALLGGGVSLLARRPGRGGLKLARTHS